MARVERHGPQGPEGRIIRVLERVNQRIVGRYESDGRFGGHVVPFDRGCCTSSSSPRATRAEPAEARWSRPRSRGRRPRRAIPRAASPACSGGSSDPGVDLKVVMAKYGLPDALPGGRRGRGRARARGRSGGRDRRPHRLPRLADRHGRSRDRARPRRRGQPRAAARRRLPPGRPHRRRGALRARGRGRSTRRPTCAAPRSTSRTAWCRCCRTRSRATSAAWSRARTG